MPTVPVGRIRDAVTLNFGNIVALGVLRLPTDFGPEHCSRSQAPKRGPKVPSPAVRTIRPGIRRCPNSVFRVPT